jgi:hypothetical protein
MKPESPAKVSFALFNCWALRPYVIRELLICRFRPSAGAWIAPGLTWGLKNNQTQIMVRRHRNHKSNVADSTMKH